jgi:DNA replication protein DnaC
MAYDGKIMRRALQRFEDDKQQRGSENRQRRRRFSPGSPVCGSIDRELRSTMGESSPRRCAAERTPALR